MMAQTSDCSVITYQLVCNFATFYPVWTHISVNIFKSCTEVMSQSSDSSGFRTSIGFKEGNIVKPTSAENNEVLPVWDYRLHQLRFKEVDVIWPFFLSKHFCRVHLVHINFINCLPLSALLLLVTPSLWGYFWPPQFLGSVEELH